MEKAKFISERKAKIMYFFKYISIKINDNLTLISEYLIFNVIFPLLPVIFTLIKSYNSNKILEWKLFTEDLLYFGITYNLVLISQIRQLEKISTSEKIVAKTVAMKNFSLLATTVFAYLIALNELTSLREDLVKLIFIILIIFIMYGTSAYILIQKEKQGGV